LTITPGSASGFAPWYASNCETLFNEAAKIWSAAPIFPAGEKSCAAAPEGALAAGY
jgi:hypothetical protein